MGDFSTDIQEIRRRAREHMERGPVTESYGADRERVIEILNEALATELVCVLRYKNNYFTATGLSAGPVVGEFLEHANEEQQHADVLARRIVQLGGTPNMNPEGLAGRSHTQYVTPEDLLDMVRENLIAERVAIATYQEIIRWLGNDDPTTRRMLEDILANEEEHADDLTSLLTEMDRATRGNGDGGGARPY